MDRLRNSIRRDIETAVSSVAQHRFATVASVDPDTHSVRVYVQPEGVLSGWIPDASAFATAGGYGVVAPLAVGDQVLVAHAHGDADHPIVVGRLFSSVDPPPSSPATGKSVGPGEFAVFTPGAWIHLAGSVVHAEATTFRLKGNVELDGTLTATGDVRASAISLQHHTHSDAQGGSVGQPE